MITKNEAANLPDLFASIVGVVDRVVLLDTGSTDGTIEVAHNLGGEHDIHVNVYEDAWDDDFARSRNLCLDYVAKICADEPNAWVIWLDGDDRLQNGPLLRSTLEAMYLDDECVDIISMEVISPTSQGGVERVLHQRMFPVTPGARFRYPVHMQLDIDAFTKVLGHVPVSGRVPEVSILHVGYADGDHQKANALRALRIVRTKLDPNDPHRLYCEARAFMSLDATDSALGAANTALKLYAAGEIELPNSALHTIYANAVGTLHGDVYAAMRALTEGMLISPHSVDLWHSMLLWSAMGLAASTAAQAAGNPGMSSMAIRTHGLIIALQNEGLFAGELPEDLLSTLKDYSTRLDAQNGT